VLLNSYSIVNQWPKHAQNIVQSQSKLASQAGRFVIFAAQAFSQSCFPSNSHRRQSKFILPVPTQVSFLIRFIKWDRPPHVKQFLIPPIPSGTFPSLHLVPSTVCLHFEVPNLAPLITVSLCYLFKRKILFYFTSTAQGSSCIVAFATLWCHIDCPDILNQSWNKRFGDIVEIYMITRNTVCV